MNAEPAKVTLTDEERKSLGCMCTRLDDEWHHIRFCRVPTVESIIAARVAAATAKALNEAAVVISLLRQVNPMNGDGSNYVLGKALDQLNKVAGSDAPTIAAREAWDQRMAEHEKRRLEIEAENQRARAVEQKGGGE